MGEDAEPVMHSHHTDVLAEDHPWAHRMIFCGHCGDMVHADNNECMQTWFEFGDGVLCGRCFAPLLTGEYGVFRPADFRALQKRAAVTVSDESRG